MVQVREQNRFLYALKVVKGMGIKRIGSFLMLFDIFLKKNSPNILSSKENAYYCTIKH